MKGMGSSRQRCGETFEPRRLEGAIYPADTYSIIKTCSLLLSRALNHDRRRFLDLWARHIGNHRHRRDRGT